MASLVLLKNMVLVLLFKIYHHTSKAESIYSINIQSLHYWQQVILMKSQAPVSRHLFAHMLYDQTVAIQNTYCVTTVENTVLALRILYCI